MTISNLVESAVNLAEKVTGKDIDGDGDTGVGVRRLFIAACPPSPLLLPSLSQPSLS